MTKKWAALFVFFIFISAGAGSALAESSSSNDGLTPEQRKALEMGVVDHLYKKGLDALAAGQFEQAEGYFDRVLTLEPRHRGAQKGIDRVMKEYEKREPSSPPKKKAKDPQAILLEKLTAQLDQNMREENWEAANGSARKILAVDPQNRAALRKKPVIMRNLYNRAVERGAARANSGDDQAAIDAYQLALSYKPDAALKEKIAELREKLADSNKAKSEELYLEALKASQANQMDHALDLCKKSLALNPKNLQAQRMLERLQSRTHP